MRVVAMGGRERVGAEEEATIPGGGEGRRRREVKEAGVGVRTCQVMIVRCFECLLLFRVRCRGREVERMR